MHESDLPHSVTGLPGPLKNIAGMLLDMDGTLVDVPHDWPAIRKRLGVGKGSILDELHDLPEPAHSLTMSELDAIESTACGAARPAPGAQDFLALLHRLGIPAALVTNNSLASVRAVLARTGWHFNIVVTRECGHWKPSPEPLRTAARNLGVPIERCIAVGDAWLDYEAGRAAGCAAVWLVEPAAHELGSAADLAAPNLAGILTALNGCCGGDSPNTPP